MNASAARAPRLPDEYAARVVTSRNAQTTLSPRAARRRWRIAGAADDRMCFRSRRRVIPGPYHSHTPPPMCAHIPVVYNSIRRVCTIIIIIIIYIRYRISRDPRSSNNRPPPAPPPPTYHKRRHEIPQVFPSLTRSLRNTRC